MIRQKSPAGWTSALLRTLAASLVTGCTVGLGVCALVWLRAARRTHRAPVSPSPVSPGPVAPGPVAPGPASPALASAAEPAPAKGFRPAALRAVRAFNEDRIAAAAAGVTFYVLLALFPALSAFVSLYGLVADVDGARRQILALGGVLPGGAIAVLGDQLARLAAANQGALSAAFFISLVFSIWSANASLKALIAGLNTAYETRENRGFVRLNLTSLGFTVGAIALAVVLIATVVDVPQLLARFGFHALAGASAVRWPALLAVSIGLLALLYRFAPARRAGRWRWITPGSALAATGWMVMSAGFSWYVGNFGHYDKTYGSLGAIVGFLTWIWLSLMIVLAGAELNCELERQAGPPHDA